MDLSKNDASAIIVNPFYAVTLASHVFKKHSSLSSKEGWVAANVHTMKDISPRVWLEELLELMTLSRAEYDEHDIINPMLAVNVSDRLSGNHEPSVTRERWIQANEKMIEGVGPEDRNAIRFRGTGRIAVIQGLFPEHYEQFVSRIDNA